MCYFPYKCRSELYKNSILGVATSASIQRAAIDRSRTQFLPTETVLLNAGHLRELKTRNESLLSALRPFFNSMALKGTQLYWEEKRKELLSMLGSENMPNSCATFFQTLSSSDRCWPEVPFIMYTVLNYSIIFVRIALSYDRSQFSYCRRCLETRGDKQCCDVIS